MTKYVLKRIIFSLFALFILLTIVYFLMSTLPFYPVQRVQGQSLDDYNNQLRRLGFIDTPLLERYGNYWKDIFVNGSLGPYYSSQGTTIQELVFPRLPNTMYIAGISFVLSILFGFTFGIISGIYRGKWQDTLVNFLSILFISIPSFIIGILLLKLAGAINIPQRFLNFGDYGWNSSDFIASSIMPVLSLTFGLASVLTYYIRNELVEVLNQDYIKTAKSKGLGFFAIIFRHSIRNALIPALSILGPSLLTVISGSIVLEQMFGVTGIATILVNSIQTNEVNVIMFTTMFFSGLYFLIVIILDISYTFIDPRIKLAQQNDASVYQITKMFVVRQMWSLRWANVFKSQSEFVNLNSSLHNLLIEKQLINYKKKTVNFFEWFYSTYNIDQNCKYLIIGKDALRIIKKESDNA